MALLPPAYFLAPVFTPRGDVVVGIPLARRTRGGSFASAGSALVRLRCLSAWMASLVAFPHRILSAIPLIKVRLRTSICVIGWWWSVGAL